jgi:hypothetical protein
MDFPIFRKGLDEWNRSESSDTPIDPYDRFIRSLPGWKMVPSMRYIRIEFCPLILARVYKRQGVPPSFFFFKKAFAFVRLS